MGTMMGTVWASAWACERGGEHGWTPFVLSLGWVLLAWGTLSSMEGCRPSGVAGGAADRCASGSAINFLTKRRTRDSKSL